MTTADDGLVTVTLSNPLRQVDCERLGVDPADPHGAGDQIRTSREGVRVLIAAGYATIDPENPAEVAKVLGAGAVIETPAVTPALSGGLVAPPPPPYEPGAYTAEQVIEHLGGLTDDAERDRILAAEKAGKNRTSITSKGV